MKYSTLLILCAGLLCFACSSADSDNPSVDTSQPEIQPLEPPAEGQGFQMEMEMVAPPYSEVWICDVMSMPNTELASVHRVEMQQTAGTHHLTLSTLGLAPGSPLEHGRYECKDLYGDSSLMENQIMFYGNQSDAEHTMILPEGVAATLPPALDMIYEMHYVNVTDQPVTVYSTINAWTMPNEEVVDGIWGGSVRDEHINIPPNSTHTEWSRCVMNEDVEILFVASHTHAKGIEFTVAPFDGETVGEVFYTNTDWHVPQIVQYEEPIVLKKGEGFEWSCTWNNKTDEKVHYGLDASDEMCNLAIVHTPFSITALCEVVETSDGVLYTP